MAGHPSDSFLRTAFASRRVAMRAGLAAMGAATGVVRGHLSTVAKHKHKHKKKKKCAKTCETGCCTGTYGTCLQPAQQSETRCGTGGAICQSTGCLQCTADRPCPDGQCCSGTGTCGSCLVFATSSLHQGGLGGLTGADAICQNLATSAGLPGPYLAWLSDGTGSPSTRFMRATMPYTLVDGSIVAVSWIDLTSGALNHAIDITETGGAAMPGNTVWTNTLTTGAVHAVTSAGTCANWTSTSPGQSGNVATSDVTTSGWTEVTSLTCNERLRLYCFQQH